MTAWPFWWGEKSWYFHLIFNISEIYSTSLIFILEYILSYTETGFKIKIMTLLNIGLYKIYIHTHMF